ncbi:MAG: fluoride efflux transporter CrcB [Phycisphaerae bacterium]|nr:fluoride efflux transporter CrcB [Phycisphaerae bacterium]
MPSTFSLLLVVALGGSAGALARFGVYLLIHGRGGRHGPWATLLVNVIGCLLLGLILGWIARRGGSNELWRTFFTVGVLGAFTTFSTYAGDALRLIHDGRLLEAGAYLLLSMSIGLAACAGGYELGARLAG